MAPSAKKKAARKNMKAVVQSSSTLSEDVPDGDKPTVLYIGKIPQGFNENELEDSFKQFGTIKRLKIARNKNGKSKPFGFIEFDSPEVAKKAVERTHNYPMHEHLLQVYLVPPKQVPPNLWKPGNHCCEPPDCVQIEKKLQDEGKGMQQTPPDLMGLSPSTFETIVSSRYISFTLPIHNLQLQIAVLDSPSCTAAASSSSTAAMWIPSGRESDWIFSTFSGHLQLLVSSSQPLARLILVGNLPSYPQFTPYNSNIHPYSLVPQQSLAPLLLALTPKSAFRTDGEIPEVLFLIYEDELVRNSILEVCEGPCVGEMLIENVELDTNGIKEFRRRLRFKRKPNFVQSQMRIYPKIEPNLENIDKMEFELDRTVLVQPYLNPMVAGISVISKFLGARMQDRCRPKALCLGVGGGTLLGFLNSQLNFEVVGVEEDEVVLKIAKRYFGLEENGDSIHLLAQDGFKYVKDLARNPNNANSFDVIMVDMDSNDVEVGVCAPPPKFTQKPVLVAIRTILSDNGVLVINTIPSSSLMYEGLVRCLGEFFEELYKIDVGNGENIVLIARRSMDESGMDGSDCIILNKLKLVIPVSYIDSIRKI